MTDALEVEIFDVVQAIEQRRVEHRALRGQAWILPDRDAEHISGTDHVWQLAGIVPRRLQVGRSTLRSSCAAERGGAHEQIDGDKDACTP